MPRDPDHLLQAYKGIIESLDDYEMSEHDSASRDDAIKDLRKAFRQFVKLINDEINDLNSGG